MVVLYFGFIWALGYIAQLKRSKRLAQLLIAAEAFIALIALFNVRHHNDFISLMTSLIDIALATWVILLAFRLMRSKGGRVVVRARVRPHRRKSD